MVGISIQTRLKLTRQCMTSQKCSTTWMNQTLTRQSFLFGTCARWRVSTLRLPYLVKVRTNYLPATLTTGCTRITTLLRSLLLNVKSCRRRQGLNWHIRLKRCQTSLARFTCTPTWLNQANFTLVNQSSMTWITQLSSLQKTLMAF